MLSSSAKGSPEASSVRGGARRYFWSGGRTARCFSLSSSYILCLDIWIAAPLASQTGEAHGKYSSRACPEMRAREGTGSAPAGGIPGVGNVLYLHLREGCTGSYIRHDPLSSILNICHFIV